MRGLSGAPQTHWLERVPALLRPRTSRRRSAAQALWGAGLTSGSRRLLGPGCISAAPVRLLGQRGRRSLGRRREVCAAAAPRDGALPLGGHRCRWLILHSSGCLCLAVLRSLA